MIQYSIACIIVVLSLTTGFYFFIFARRIPRFHAANYFVLCCIHFGVLILFHEDIVYFFFNDFMLLKKIEYSLFAGIPLSMTPYVYAVSGAKKDWFSKISIFIGIFLVLCFLTLLFENTDPVAYLTYLRYAQIYVAATGIVLSYVYWKNRFKFNSYELSYICISHFFIMSAGLMDIGISLKNSALPKIFSLATFAFIFLNGLLVRSKLDYVQNSIKEQSRRFSEIARYFFLTKSYRAFLLSCFSLATKKLGYDLCALELVSYHQKKIFLSTDESLFKYIDELDIPSKKKTQIYRLEKEQNILFMIPISHLRYRRQYKGCLIIGIKKYEIEEHHMRVFDILQTMISAQVMSLDHQNHLEWLNRSLENKVLERTLEIETQYDHLKVMKENQMNFFASITHDIRTPLSLITMPLEKLITQSATKEEIKSNALYKVKYNVYKIIQTINSLLDTAKIELNKVSFNTSLNDMNSFLKKLSEIYSEIVISYGMHLVLNLPQRRVWVHFDAEKIEKVIDNLLNNAIKHSKPSGNIVLSLNVSYDQNVKIKLRNYGKGLNAQERKRIFTPFEQVNDRKGISGLGSGLGLSICKEYIEKHKGKISVFSRLNSYTEFIITLSMAEPPDETGTDRSISREPYSVLHSLEMAKAYRQLKEKKFLDQKDQIACLFWGRKSTWKEAIQALEEEYHIEIFQKTPSYANKPEPSNYISIIFFIDELEKIHTEMIVQLKEESKFKYIPIMLLVKTDPQMLIPECLDKGADHCLLEPVHPMEIVIKNKSYSEFKRLLEVLNQPASQMSKPPVSGRLR